MKITSDLFKNKDPSFNSIETIIRAMPKQEGPKVIIWIQFTDHDHYMNMKKRAITANIMLKTTDDPAVVTETTAVVLAETALESRATANSVVCVHSHTK